MIVELTQLITSLILGEVSRKLDFKVKIEVKEKIFQIHHNVLGLVLIISSFLFNFNIFFFGGGLVIHHLITEGW